MGHEAMEMEWDAGLIVISYFISVQAAYSALLTLQMRTSRWLLPVAALCLSVSGIWAMHFIGMSAMSLHGDVQYAVGWTIASVVFAYVPTLVAFFLIDHATSKEPDTDTRDISLEAHITAIKSAPHAHLVTSAFIIALGVCAMHYLGIHAVTIPGTARYLDWGVIIASCIIAIFAATAALYFAFVLPSTREYTLPTSLVAGAAVCGMHYCGMYGVRYERLDPTSAATSGSSSIDSYTVYIVFVSSMISSAALALTSYLYRAGLRGAADSSESYADLILTGRFSELQQEQQRHDNEDANNGRHQDPLIGRIRLSNARLGAQLQLLVSFLPPSLMAQFESLRAPAPAAADTEERRNSSLVEEDDEGDLVISGSGFASGLGKRNSRPNDIGGSFRGSGSVLQSPMGSAHSSPMQFETGLEHRNVAVLYLNCHGFHDYMNEAGANFEDHYSTFTEAVQRISKQHKGVLDQIHGDRVMISFNASLRNASSSQSCASASVTLAKELTAATTTTSTSNKVCRIGCVAIGFAKGPALVGNMGSRGLMRYSICGPVVAHAAKLQHLCTREHHASTGVHVLGFVTPELHMAVRYRAMDVVKWQGMTKPTILCEVLSIVEGENDEEWMYELAHNAEDDPFAAVNREFGDYIESILPTSVDGYTKATSVTTPQPDSTGHVHDDNDGLVSIVAVDVRKKKASVSSKSMVMAPSRNGDGSSMTFSSNSNSVIHLAKKGELLPLCEGCPLHVTRSIAQLEKQSRTALDKLNHHRDGGVGPK